MNSHKLAAIISTILALILVVGAIFAITHNYQELKQEEIQAVELPPVPPEYLEPTTEPAAQVSKREEWSMPSRDLLSYVECDEQWLPAPTGEITLREIELTGDTNLEGIFACGNGSGDSVYIFTKQGNTGIPVQVKSKEGMIGPISFYRRGTVMYTSGFKLLPEEHGFYDYSSAYDNDKERFECRDVDTYTWNPKTHLFEWNAELTKKYTKQYRDNECQWEDEY